MLTHERQQILRTIIKELNIKCLVIIKKDPSEFIKALILAKLFPQQKLYLSFYSAAEMYGFISEHNEIWKNSSTYKRNQEYEYTDVKGLLNKSRPKTMVLLRGENPEKILRTLFTVGKCV